MLAGRTTERARQPSQPRVQKTRQLGEQPGLQATTAGRSDAEQPGTRALEPAAILSERSSTDASKSSRDLPKGSPLELTAFSRLSREPTSWDEPHKGSPHQNAEVAVVCNYTTDPRRTRLSQK